MSRIVCGPNSLSFRTVHQSDAQTAPESILLVSSPLTEHHLA